jgi:hypothetical protein
MKGNEKYDWDHKRNLSVDEMVHFPINELEK